MCTLKVIAVIDVEDYFSITSRAGKKLSNPLVCWKSSTALSWVLLAAFCRAPDVAVWQRSPRDQTVG